MFKVREKKTDEIMDVFATNGDLFLIWRDGAFQWESNEGFAPVSIIPSTVNDCVLSMGGSWEARLSDIIDRIKNGDVLLSIGDALTVALQDGKKVDFVVTDVDNESYRFESRDCLGRYTPMTEIDTFFADVWAALPAVLRDNIIDTEREYKDARDKVHIETRKLFLPSASEIFPPEDCYGDKGVYKQMEWYKNVHNRVRAFEKGGAAEWYWTQSPYSGNTTNWCRVTLDGLATYANASATSIAAPVCFRIPRFPVPRP